MIPKKLKTLKIMTIVAVFALIVGLQAEKIFVRLQLSFYKNYYQATGQRLKNFNSRIETISFSSPSLNGQQREYRVYIPKAYDENPKQKFPVLYLLHGFPGTDQDWLINGNLQSQLDKMITDGRLKPLLAVFPDGNGPKITSSQYVNATTANQNMEDLVAKDLVKDVDARFRTINDRAARAIGGNSSGGYGAINIGLKHNDEFGIILVHGGFFDNWHNELDKVFGKDQNAIDANSPMKYLSQMTVDPQTFVYLTIGQKDSGSMIEENRRFSDLLAQKGIPYELVFTSSIHSWGSWKESVGPSLEYMNRYLRYN